MWLLLSRQDDRYCTKQDNRFCATTKGKIKWWIRPGSNRLPPRCERGALPDELRTHALDYYTQPNVMFNPNKSLYARVRTLNISPRFSATSSVYLILSHFRPLKSMQIQLKNHSKLNHLRGFCIVF